MSNQDIAHDDTANKTSSPISSFGESDTGHGRKAVRMGVTWGIIASSFALLIWWKLRAVTNTPRSAYAEPKAIFPPAKKYDPAPDPAAPLPDVPNQNVPEQLQVDSAAD